MAEESFSVVRTKLPEEVRYANYHRTAGLIVCQLSALLPSEIAATHSQDLINPRFLDDSNVYMAFFPRISLRGKIFSSLNVGSLKPYIQRRASGDYSLDGLLIEKWFKLEKDLLDLTVVLLRHHQGAGKMPTVECPRLPSSYGFRGNYSSREDTFERAKASRDAFQLFSAYVTFVLTIWLTEYRQDCFELAWSTVEQKSNRFSRLWLEELQDSTICNLSAGIRPGGFLDPNRTRWRPALPFFARASVPIWLLWGNPTDYNPCDKGMSDYYPSRSILEQAKKQEIKYASIIQPHIILPYQHANAPTSIARPADAQLNTLSTQIVGRSPLPPLPPPTVFESVPTQIPDEPFPLDEIPMAVDWEAPVVVNDVDRSQIVEKYSRQRPGETWPMFYQRMREAERRCREHESPKEKQSRDAKAAHARAGMCAKSATIFKWEEDEIDPTVFRRCRVLKAEQSFEFRECDPARRFYWSHVDEWDLCSDMASIPVQVNRCMYTDDPVDDCTCPLCKPNGAIVEPQPAPVTPAFLTVGDYLSKRHGYDSSVHVWNVELHGNSLTLKEGEDERVIKHLLFTAEDASSQRWLVNWHNTMLKDGLSCSQLPSAWDISDTPENLVNICDQKRLKLTVADAAFQFDGQPQKLYVLSPPSRSETDPRWLVATTSATAVLFAYRQRFTSVIDVARCFLLYGISFRTVLMIDKSEVQVHAAGSEIVQPSKVHALGIRNRDFKPTRADYDAYLETRESILRSASGRAVRMRGGIAGRIAADVVPATAILDGPNYANEVVGCLGDTRFVDDRVDANTLDIVCGVYYIKMSESAEKFSHSSFWPKQNVWETSGFAGDQWQPAAETRYQQRLGDFDPEKEIQLSSSTVWKTKLRFFSRQTRWILRTSDDLAAKYIARTVAISG